MSRWNKKSERKGVSGIMLTILLTSLLIPVLHQATAEANYEENPRIEFSPREIIVKLKSSISVDVQSGVLAFGVPSVDRLNKRHGVAGIRKVFATSHPSISNIYKLKFSADVDILRIVEEYNSDPNIVYAEPNYIGRAAHTPNDADYASQWAHPKMQSELAWNITTGNSNIVIAVIDTGVDWNHPDLAANIWTNPAETLNGIDDDSNGYTDDIRGWDFVDTAYPVWPGEDGTVRDNDPMDFHGHGTHVAGIASAVTNNTIGVAGMSWTSKIMAVRAGYKAPDGDSWFWWSDVAPAITYAADNGASIISMSFGGYGFSSLLKNAVDYAYAQGVVLIAAAMNDNIETEPYPGGYGNVTAVAATNSTDGKASFSNYGSWVDVAAPGVSIYSTLFDDTYASWSGTSMSTPYVAGLASLILSENETLTNEEVRNVICNTADPVSSSVYIGTGRINAHKALMSVRVPRTWTVDDDGPADYKAIQEAINAAYLGDTILVAPGTYYEHVVIDKSVSLIGENRSTTIIDGYNTGGNVVFIAADNVNINGFTLQKGDIGIYVLSDYNNINNNIITANNYGIVLEGFSNNVISENNITNNSWYGIVIVGWVFDYCHNRIFRNNIRNNNYGIFVLDGSNGNKFFENNIAYNNVGLVLDNVAGDPSEGNIIYHNNFVSNAEQAGDSGDNSWHDSYPSGGNYWSNYADVDTFSGPHQNETGSDSIWDHPYEHGAHLVDNYPLVSPWTHAIIHTENVTKAGESYEVQVISNSTLLAFDETPGSIKLSVSGGTGTSGYVRIIQPIDLNASKIKVFLNHTRLTFPSYDPPASISKNSTHYFIYFTFSFLSTVNISVQFQILGDITGSETGIPDGVVDNMDVALAVTAFGSKYTDLLWSDHADITGPISQEPDGKVDIRDVYLISKNYGKTWIP